MRRIVIAASLVTLLGMAAVVGYGVVRRETEYRRLIAEGDAAAASDQTFVAIEAFSGALTLKPESMLAHLRRGEAYRKRGEWRAALRDLRRACDLDPAAPQPIEQLGDVYFERGNYSAAADQYQRYIDLDDRSPRVLYKLGMARHSGGHVTEAMAALRRAIALDDRFAEARYLLGLCLRENGQRPAALDELRRAIAIAPALVPAREELAALYRASDQKREETEQLSALADIEPAHAERQVALGLGYARAGRTDLAVTTLSAAATRFPQQRAVFAAVGRLWLDAAEPHGDRAALRKALAALNRITTGADADSETLTLFGRALLAAGDFEGAEQVLRQAGERFPVDPAAFTLMASAARRNRRPAVARDALLKYVSLTGSRTESRVFVELGDLSLQINDPATAVGWYERALRQAPDAQVESSLAEAQMRSGDVTAAQSTLEHALARDPDHPALLALARKLKPRTVTGVR